MAGSLLSTKALAGSLDPPPGPPAPSGRRLSSLADRMNSISQKIARTTSGVAEPRTPVKSLLPSSDSLYEITVSGSYYLTENIQGVAGMNGIRISADNVDLDLCGFHIKGAADPGGLATGSGIISSSQNVSIVDGTTIGWLRGVDLEHASMFIVWDVTSIGASAGAFFLGDRGQSYDNDAYNCPGMGFVLLGTNTLVEQCGAWTCGTGFKGINSPNLLLRNCATQCTTPFDLAQGNSYGPIVVVTGIGDISVIANTRHPEANYVH